MKILSLLIFLLTIIPLLANCGSSKSRQEHFNELASSPEWQPDKVIETLAIQKGWNIGDLGAGGGYYTYRFAEETGSNGKVYAADINKEFLEGINNTAKEKGYANVQTILSSPDDSNFEDNSLDLLFTRNTFHHIENKNQYMKNLVPKLKEGGKIVLIDYKDEGLHSLFGHNVSREEILTSIENTGLVIEKEYDFLEKQYFFVLKKE
jgi:ubiquinone/menaquinone biosynthesis C-methylase UbiE